LKCKMVSGEADNDNNRQDDRWRHIPELKVLDEDWSGYPCS